MNSLVLGTHLKYLSSYLDQETTKWPFRSSSQAATCYYQTNHSKIEAIFSSIARGGEGASGGPALRGAGLDGVPAHFLQSFINVF